MADIVELIPVNEQDEQIFAAWETGKGLRALSRQFGLSVTQIQEVLDRALPAFDEQKPIACVQAGATSFGGFERRVLHHREARSLSG